jgi:glycosyltransferase involved in cell wall biosynthesis
VTQVDVMLPHYGRLDLVQATVRSVLDQVDPNWRLTIVDDSGDAGDDKLGAWCAGLGDRRVRYERNAHNLGINRNFQKCVSLVEHELAVIIGSDDLMLPGYVRTVRQAHQTHPDVAIIQPGVEVVDEHGELVRTLVDLSKRWVYAPRAAGPTVLAGQDLAVSLLRGNWLYFPSICWRAEPLRRIGFREGLSVVQDLALVLDMVLDGESLLVEPTRCFRYRRHRASVSSAHAADGRRFAEERGFFIDAAERMAARGWSRAAAAARHHLSSRINALTQLPSAVRHGGSGGVGALVRHAFGGVRRCRVTTGRRILP